MMDVLDDSHDWIKEVRVDAGRNEIWLSEERADRTRGSIICSIGVPRPQPAVLSLSERTRRCRIIDLTRAYRHRHPRSRPALPIGPEPRGEPIDWWFDRCGVRIRGTGNVPGFERRRVR